MKRKSFSTEMTPLDKINAIQRNWLTYVFQIVAEDEAIPLQPLHKKPHFAFTVSYKLLAAEDVSLLTIVTVADEIQALYPKGECEWSTEITDSVKPGYIIVSLIESL